MTTNDLPAVRPEDVATAFGLERPVGTLVLVQHTVSRTWRLRAGGGDFLVKELWPGDDPPWAGQVAARMAFEERAAAAGIRLPAAVRPPHPVFGHAARVAGRGAYRVTRWLPHRKPTAGDDLAEWLGQTLATLQTLQPHHPAAEPVEPSWYVHPAARWHGWLDAARRQRRPWAPTLADHLPSLLALTGRLRAAHRDATDHVVTHRDLIPANVLLTATGPVLIDWDVVGPDSAALETGFAAAAFARDDPARLRRVLDAYRAHGGVLPTDRGPRLFAHAVGARLGRLADLVDGLLAREPLTGWRAAFPDPDHAVRHLLDAVTGTARRFEV